MLFRSSGTALDRQASGVADSQHCPAADLPTTTTSGVQRCSHSTDLSQKGDKSGDCQPTNDAGKTVQEPKKTTQSSVVGIHQPCANIQEKVQENPALTAHATAGPQLLLSHLERMEASSTDLATIAGPLVGRNDGLGFSLKRLHPFIERPVDKRRKLATVHDTNMLEARQLVANSGRGKQKVTAMGQLQAQVVEKQKEQQVKERK